MSSKDHYTVNEKVSYSFELLDTKSSSDNFEFSLQYIKQNEKFTECTNTEQHNEQQWLHLSKYEPCKKICKMSSILKSMVHFRKHSYYYNLTVHYAMLKGVFSH